MDFVSLRWGGGSGDDYSFRMHCPFCASGTLLINADPELKHDMIGEWYWGIRARRCDPDCSCPLTDAEIAAIERECERGPGCSYDSPACVNKNDR